MCGVDEDGMTIEERAHFRRLATMQGHQLYVFRSTDESGGRIWAYSATPPMGRLCVLIGPMGWCDEAIPPKTPG